MKRLQHAIVPAGAVSLAFFGVAFARAWLTLAFVDSGQVVGVAALPHDVFDAGYVAASVAAVLLARPVVPLATHGWAYAFAAAGMLFASAVFSAGMWVGLEGWLVRAAALLGGAAYAVFLLMNAEAFAGVSVLRIVLYLSGSRVLASVLTWLLQACDPARMAFALGVLPLVALGLLGVSHASLPAADRQRPDYPRYSFPWKLVVLVAVFSFAYGLRRAELAPGAGQHSSLSTAVVMGTVFLVAYFFPNRIDVAALCRAPVPLMLCGLLLVPFEGLVGDVASSYLVSVSYTLMNLMVALLFYDMAKRTGVAVVPLMGALDAMQAFVLAGSGVSRLVHGAPFLSEGADAVASVLVCVALVVSFLLLFSERELSSRWGIEVLHASSLDAGGAEADRLAARCGELAELYGLTPREDEVLREIARRKDSQSIAQNLLIAPGTLKAHTRHIYEKMGIHTRGELYALLGIEGDLPA